MSGRAIKGADFRAQRSQIKDRGWLKHIGKLGFPAHALLRLYQMTVVFWDLVYLAIRAYKELVISAIFFVLPISKKTLTNEIVVIVGSSRGLGRELAAKIGRLHATVICIDLQTPELETTSKMVTEAGDAAFYYQCDITSKDQVERTMSKVEKDIGVITMLYHCCALPSPRPVVTNPPTAKQTIDVSVTSYFYLLDSILPHMKSNCKGHIVFLTSVAAISGFTQQRALSVSQFAIQGFYESIVEELRVSRLDKNIRTTLVHIYPHIAGEGRETDVGMRVPGFFGSIKANKAANAIIEGVRKNKPEISIPKYFLFISRILKIFPKQITLLLRDFLDTGLDF